MNTLRTWLARLTPRRASVLAVAVVAGVAAVVSYAHMKQLADTAGEGWRSHLLPLSVDGLLIAAAMSMVVARLHNHRPSTLAWFALVLGILASLAANVAAAEPTWVGRLVAAWSPVALALSFELLMQQIRRTPSRDTASATKEAAGAPSTEPAAAPHDTERDAQPAPARPNRAPRRAPKAPRTRAGRAAPNGARTKARALFDRAVAERRADDMTGAELARAVGAHEGTARKWLAAWRAETQPSQPTESTEQDIAGADARRLAVVGESYPGGGA